MFHGESRLIRSDLPQRNKCCGKTIILEKRERDEIPSKEQGRLCLGRSMMEEVTGLRWEELRLIRSCLWIDSLGQRDLVVQVILKPCPADHHMNIVYRVLNAEI